jgi:predicted transcriptional regulator
MPKSTEKLMLIHPTRLQIYKIICESPGTYFYKLMSELPKYSDKVSSATLIYHLKKLNESNLIETAKIDENGFILPEKSFEMQKLNEHLCYFRTKTQKKYFCMF